MRRQAAAQSPRGEPGTHIRWGESTRVVVGIASVPNPSANPVGGDMEGTCMTVRPRRWFVLALAPLLAVSAMLVAPATPASADPDGTSATADDGDDNPLLNDVLDSTGRRYLSAKAAVAKSTKTQLTLAIEVRDAEAKRDALLPQVDAMAAQQYRTGGVSSASFLLNSANSNAFLERAIALEEINALNDGKL